MRDEIAKSWRAHLLPNVVNVEQILTALEVDNVTRHELLVLARVANTEYQDVRSPVRQGLYHRSVN